MAKVPLVEYDEIGTRSVVGEATIEVVIKDGQLVVTPSMIHPTAELAKRLNPIVKPGDFSL